jgi:ABC-type uncharacterized transport system substrate-binding protein
LWGRRKRWLFLADECVGPARLILAFAGRAGSVPTMKVWAMIGCGVVAGLAGPALAHPHVFIDTKVEVMLDTDNRATGVMISWTYDDLYSLYVVGDMGLDPDWDGKLTPEEEAKLSGFDMNWDAGFAGDTYALMDDRDLPLSRPKNWSASYAGGKITSVHERSFEVPVPIAAVPLIVQVYDPGFYTAYTIPFDPVLTGGAGCTADAFAPDASAADETLRAALAEYSADVDLEADFPAIGKAYSEEVRVTCAGP